MVLVRTSQVESKNRRLILSLKLHRDGQEPDVRRVCFLVFSKASDKLLSGLSIVRRVITFKMIPQWSWTHVVSASSAIRGLADAKTVTFLIIS